MATYRVSKTLGAEDKNRRTIYRFRNETDRGCGVAVCVFNQEMRDWTQVHETELLAALNALNAMEK